MQKEFIQFIERHELISPQQRVLVAVSGGVDSMVLLHLLHQAGFTTGVAHVNFSLRGKESDEDEALVQQTCKRLKIPFFSNRFDTAAYAEEHKLGIQEAARDLRYQWFAQLAAQEGYDKTATAHHATDHAETLLFNLVRGTGLKGLEGIPLQNGQIIRPMLFATRREVEQYAKKHRISFRHDRSNDTDAYTRNRIRHEVLPELLRINQATEDHLFHTSEVVRKANKWIAYETHKWLKKNSEKAHGKWVIQIKPLLKHEVADLLLYQILQPYGFHADQATQIVAALNGQAGKEFYSPTHRLLKDRETLILTTLAEKEVKTYELKEKSGKLETNRFSLTWKEKKKPTVLKTDVFTALLNTAKLVFPLTLRYWEPGDRFQPLGMKGMKKVSDFLIDAKVSRSDKETTLVLLSGKDIVWVVGHRPDERYKVKPTLQTVMEITYKPATG